MPQPYLEWDWDWREKSTGRTGTYRSGSVGLQTAEDVANHVANCFKKLEFLAARLVGEGRPKTSPDSFTPVNPINPEHVLIGTIAERNEVVREFNRGPRSGRHRPQSESPPSPSRPPAVVPASRFGQRRSFR